MTSKAFCPGHITGFFSIPIERKKAMNKVGSKGAGFSIALGATAEAEVEGNGWDITVNGEKTSFLVVEKTLFNLAPGGKVELSTDIPFSQGFGMSGACALAAGTAVLGELGEKDSDKALNAAHESEIFCRTGLGDVIGQYNGGFETRVKGGLPPHGEIKVEERDDDVVIGIIGSPFSTPDILNDAIMSAWIKAIGDDMMEEFMPEDGFDRFLDLSLQFAEETKFIKDEMQPIINKCSEYGKGSMAMIGNSIFFFGDTDKLEEVMVEELREDNVYVTKIDPKGARLIS
ncbi:MAG: pantoate kinase [Thermoplasmatota archaeon]